MTFGEARDVDALALTLVLSIAKASLLLDRDIMVGMARGKPLFRAHIHE
jgi:hypothetical protein